MEFLQGWITNIILFILLATVIDMLLPNSAMQKYTKMVIGLLLITIILTPVLKLFSLDMNEILNSIEIEEKNSDENIEILMESKKSEIQASQRAYILEQMAVQLKEDVEGELMQQFNMNIQSIDITMDELKDEEFPNNLKSVNVRLSNTASDDSTEVIKVVKTVEIDTQKQYDKPISNQHIDEVHQWLSTRWELNSDMIEIQIEGGS